MGDHVDPVPPRWAETLLPDAWTDREASGARGAWRLLRHALGRRRAGVELPVGLPLVAHGIEEVWGLDPSPYLLRCADARVPRARFVQGVAERTGFGDERFDGVACCFLFHELPPRAADQALAELARIARPRARLAIVEPAREQY